MTIQPGNPGAGHHQARNTQELLDAADQVGQRQQQYSRDPSTDEIPVPAEQLEQQDRQRDDQRDGRDPRDPASRGPADQTAQQDPATRQSEPMVEPPAHEPGEPVTEQAQAGQAQAGRAQAEAVQAEQAPVEQEHSEGKRHARDTEDEHVALFDPREAEELQGRWREVQTAFVDDPRSAVQGADQLVAQVIQSLTASFAAHKKELDGQWQDTDQSGPATEDLRLALRRYRTLFNQLLNT